MHDNIIREKLQAMDDLPAGMHFNAEATWQQVENHLQPRSNSKRTWWLGAAAILLLAVLSVVLVDKQPSTPATVITRPAVNTTPTAVKAVHPTPASASRVMTTHPFSKKQQLVSDSKTIVEGNNDAPITTEPVPVIIAQTTTVTDSAAKMITTQPIATHVKKNRLKVIHLDELYQRLPEEIVKAELKKQSEEPVLQQEPVITSPPRSFWKTKSPPKTAITLTDNQ
jgi:hypothetical protein